MAVESVENMQNGKLAIVFPGQGSQYVGMGKDIYDKFEEARNIFDQASEVLGYDMAEKCFRSTKLGKFIHRTDLDRTIYTQPAVLTASYACYRVFKQICGECAVPLKPSFLAGHSLGEYTALLVSGALDFETTVYLVNKRAKYITDFAEHYPDAGLMAIVDRGNALDFATINGICKEFQVYVTLINTKSQIVVGGFKKNLSELSKKIKKDGKIATTLRVEGPFHTPLMKPAADRFKQLLDESDFSIASVPVIANTSTQAIVDPVHIKNELYHQIFESIDWRSSVEKALQNGARLFIEVGPKKVLTTMIKTIDDSVAGLNVEDVASLEKTVKELAKQTTSES